MASRNAYALLGLAFIIVFGAAYVLVSEQALAPEEDAQQSLTASSRDVSMTFTLTSSAFDNDGFIPAAFTCDGDNSNPPLTISGIPEGTQSLVLVMDDPDIPQEVKDANGIEKFNHWAAYNIPADTKEIAAGAAVGSAGTNGRGATDYTGPCPPPQYEPTEHRYIFRLYALSGTLNFIKTPTLDEVEAAAQSMTIASTTLIGRYDRTK